MAGTSEGARKAHQTTLKRHGSEFIEDRGRKGGRISRGGGFSDPAAASAAAKKSHTNRRRADPGGPA